MIEHEVQRKHPLSWFLRGIGAQVLEKEVASLHTTLDSCHITRLLQLGGPPLITYHSKFHYVHLDNANNFATLGHNVISSFTEIGLASGCADLVVIPHLQELHPDFKQVLAEVFRILSDDGIVVVFGFNPVSIWGVQRVLGLGTVVPWCNRFFSAATVIKDFVDTDFTYIGKKSFFPGINSDYPIIYSLNSIFERFNLDSGGAIYKLTFQKRVSTMTLNTERSIYFSP